MTFCLVVVTILGVHCFSSPADFSPPGDCTHLGDITLCYADESDFLVRASWYDPFIQTDDPAVAAYQCADPCDLLGDGTPVVEGYGRMVACPLGWYGRYLDFPGIGQRQCRDHGGAVTLACGELGEYTCWIVVDFLEREAPWWAYQMLQWGPSG